MASAASGSRSPTRRRALRAPSERSRPSTASSVKSARSSDFGHGARKTGCRDSAPLPWRRCLPRSRHDHPGSNGMPPSRATHWSMSAFPGPLSKATGSPSSGTQVTFEIPPILTKALARDRAAPGAAKRQAPYGRLETSGAPCPPATMSAARMSQTTGRPVSAARMSAVAELNGQRVTGPVKHRLS